MAVGAKNKMMALVVLGRAIVLLQQFLRGSKAKLLCVLSHLYHLFQWLLLRVNQFWIELVYFLFLSVIGYGALKVCKTDAQTLSYADFDVFFMSASAATVSSMSTMEMEVFSNPQLIILAMLMLSGGDVFSSLIGLRLLKLKSTEYATQENRVDPSRSGSGPSNPTSFHQQLQLSEASHSDIDIEKPGFMTETWPKCLESPEMRRKAIELLLYVVLCYLLAVHLAGSALVYIYVSLVSSAQQVLMKKRIHLITFSAFMASSTFANGGFVPTNENMSAFKKNPGLFLILIPQVLMGNTLYPAFLRFMIWVLERTTKLPEFSYILRYSRELGYTHMFSGLRTTFLGLTALGFILVQLVCFCSLEWDSIATTGLSNYQKIVGSLFQVINSRHAGESAFDFSLISPSMLLLFVVMMYLPPYTCFLPFNKEGSIITTKENTGKEKGKFSTVYFLLSPLCYLLVFMFLICITEREKMKDDPLNFTVFNIVLEVISAYGNVGFSMGYSCEKQMKPSGHCKDASYGFVGRWSYQGRFILIVVMFCGKLKKFGVNGGKVWRFL